MVRLNETLDSQIANPHRLMVSHRRRACSAQQSRRALELLAIYRHCGSYFKLFDLHASLVQTFNSKGQMKRLCCSYWAATIFALGYFCQPGLLLQACLPNPTNQWYIAQTTTPTSTDPAPQDTHKNFIVALIVAAIGIAVVGYIIYQLVKLAAKIKPPDPPPPDPSSPTNSQPVVFNPKGSPGPAPADATRMIPDTNSTWGTIGYYNITTLNYKDQWAKSQPQYFQAFWSTSMKTSTNLVDWEDSHYVVNSFVSPGGTFVAYFHYGTNYYNAYFSDTNQPCVWFDLTDKPYLPTQFFRLDPR